MSFFLPIFQALEARKVRYVLAGGLATVFHGHQRLTGDIDLIIDLEEHNCRLALETFQALGFRPRAPVPMMDFANPQRRSEWIREKGLKVFSLFPPPGTFFEIDLFVEAPFPFEDLYKNAVVKEVDGVTVKVLSIAHLTELKKAAGRAQDLEDIKALEAIELDSENEK